MVPESEMTPVREEENRHKRDFFEGSAIRVLLHLLAWIILLVLPVYFIKRWNIAVDFIWLYYVNMVISGIIFYVNYVILVPRYFFQLKRYRYYLAVLLLLVFFYFVSDQSNKQIFQNLSDRPRIEKPQFPPDNGRPDNGRMHGPPMRSMHIFNYGFNAIFIIFFSLGLRMVERHTSIEKARKELEKEKLNSELAFLKNQISPHFFFNTLNNIYSLIAINAGDSQKAVLKLSKMMRYLLYESEKGDTKLSNEIEFMNNYLDLMKLRLSEKVGLTVDFPGKYTDFSIPPLLFIPFIENAFKHGISFRDKSFIEISLKTENERIYFKCRNSIAQTASNGENENSGIGLGNVRKRLELLFPGKHELSINSDISAFNVNLIIYIKG